MKTTARAESIAIRLMTIISKLGAVISSLKVFPEHRKPSAAFAKIAIFRQYFDLFRGENGFHPLSYNQDF